jgi:WD40 repeat protein
VVTERRLAGKIGVCAISPDMTTVASTADGVAIDLWDARTAAHLATLRGHTDRVNALAFLPNGRVLASASNDMAVRVWDVARACCMGILHGSTCNIDVVDISYDSVVAISEDGKMHTWGVVDALASMLEKVAVSMSARDDVEIE